jgi:hypothetical protein
VKSSIYLRPVRTLWLPGDESEVMEFELRRAIRQDNLLNAWEQRVVLLLRACRGAKGSHPWWRCTQDAPCVFCEEAAEL